MTDTQPQSPPDPAKADLAALISRVEACTGNPDYQLTRDLAVALGLWKPVKHPEFGDMIEYEDGLFIDHEGTIYPAFLESLDSVMGLVEAQMPGRGWATGRAGRHDEDTRYMGMVERDAGADHDSGDYEARAPSPALALLLAFLRAKQSQSTEGG